jgi:hypothetical protein
MFEKFAIVKELIGFMRRYKKWWIGPMMMFLILLGIVLVFAEGSALAPFIYTLF